MGEGHARQCNIVDILAAAAQQPRVLETRHALTDRKLTHRSPRNSNADNHSAVIPGREPQARLRASSTRYGERTRNPEARAEPASGFRARALRRAPE